MNYERFTWLELKPQLRFKDDRENNIVGVIQHASEFAFFTIHDRFEMKIIVRTTDRDANLFRIIPGITAEVIRRPVFDKVVAGYLTLSGPKSLEPLVGLDTITRSNMYAKLWSENHTCLMACFAYNNTKHIARLINQKIKLENRTGKKSVSSKSRAEIASAKKRQGHSHYNCTIVFGVKPDSTGRSDMKNARRILDCLIGNTLLNAFAHKISVHRLELFTGRKRVVHRLASMLGTTFIDPYSFMPKKLYSKSIPLSEIELAYFISLPQERDIQTINFGVGSTPTFVRYKREDISSTDLTMQSSGQDHTDGQERTP